MSKVNHIKPFTLGFIAFCAALNAGIGFLVQVLKLPLYLDLIGSILAACLLGPVHGTIVAVVGIFTLGIVTTPTAFAYVGTAIAVTICGYYFTRFGYLRRWPATILFGIILGIISAILSAPITTYLFGGVSFVGADAVTAFFKATGETIATSVLLGGLATDPVDKVLLSICCHLLIANMPKRLLARFPGSRVLG